MYLHTRTANERLLVQFQAETQIPFGGRKGIYTTTSAHNKENCSSLQTNSDKTTSIALNFSVKDSFIGEKAKTTKER